MTKPVYEIAVINGLQVTVDTSLLSASGEMYFNATEIAKSHNKKADDFLRLGSTKEYISIVEKERDSNVGNSRFKNCEKLVRITKGKYGGTWIHKEIAFEFGGWCSAIFRRAMHKYAEQRLIQELNYQRQRQESKTGFLPMTNAIQLAHDPVKPYHFSNECNMINRIVLGMSAKEFKLKYGTDSVRDHVTPDEIAAITLLQQTNTGLINIGMTYQERKKHLTALHENRFARIAA